MEYQHLAQAELANKLNVSQKTVDDILNRKKFLDKSLALRAEKVLEISSKLLLFLDKNKCIETRLKLLDMIHIMSSPLEEKDGGNEPVVRDALEKLSKE